MRSCLALGMRRLGTRWQVMGARGDVVRHVFILGNHFKHNMLYLHRGGGRLASHLSHWALLHALSDPIAYRQINRYKVKRL